MNNRHTILNSHEGDKSFTRESYNINAFTQVKSHLNYCNAASHSNNQEKLENFQKFIAENNNYLKADI